MTDILIYLLKVSLAISLVSIPYYLWLRQDAALNIKRIYMVGGIILSWLFPLIVIRKPQAISTFTQTFLIDPDAVTAPAASTSASALPESASGFTISLFSIVLGIYLIGMLILAMRHILMFRILKSMERHGDNNDRNVVYTNSKQIFTLFSKIFIPEDLRSSNEYNSILIHEKAHLQQLHMIDLVIAESNLLLTWFNPFSWLISRMIKENHEHLADRAVLSKGVNPAHYKAQLLNHTMGVELFRLGNQFNHSLTKKRFQMMKKIKSPKKGFVKYLALVPMMLVVLALFTASSIQQKEIKGKVVFEDGSAAPGTSIVVAGGTQGTVADMQGDFSIEVDGNTELIFSFVGFKSVKIKAKEAARKNVVLQPKAFKMDLEDVETAEYKAESKEAKSEDSSDEKIVNPTKEIFYIVEDLPSFPGGKEMLKGYIDKNLEYPEQAKKKALSGEVYVQFTVKHNGELEDIDVKKSSDKLFNEAAMDVFRDMPLWNPGKQRGKPVSAQVIVPVRFGIEKD